MNWMANISSKLDIIEDLLIESAKRCGIDDGANYRRRATRARAVRWRHSFAQAQPAPTSGASTRSLRTVRPRYVKFLRYSLGKIRLSPLARRWTAWRGRRSHSLYARARHSVPSARCRTARFCPLCTRRRITVCGVCVTVQHSRWTVRRWRGGETCVAISDRQDGGVPGAVVVERCTSHGSRQRVGQRGGFRSLTRT